MRVAYVVSRFPDASETFVLRELNGVDGREGTEVFLHALFPPKHAFVHPDAEAWTGRVTRVSPLEALLALVYWTLAAPRELLGALASVLRSFGRSPERLARSLIAFAVGAAHARTMRDERVDHIHAHFATYPALAAWLAARLLDVGYSFTAHAHDIFVDQLHLDVLLDQAGAVVTISDFNRRMLGELAPAAEPRIRVVHCGVDPGAYAFDPRRLPREGPIRAVCVATLNELKGHATLLEALGSDSPVMARVSLDLVGSGPLEAQLREQAARLGVADRVRFRGTLSEPEVSAILKAADLFVLASVVAANGRMDGIPVALMEALASGLPVISTRLSGIPELVRDGETGVLVAPGDPVSLVDGFERTLADPEATLARACVGRDLVEREFAILHSSEQMVAIFRDATASR